MKYPISDNEKIFNILVYLALLIICFLIDLSLAKAQTPYDIESIIVQSAERNGIEPDIALSIAKVESGLNPNAIGNLKEVGLFQLRPEFHQVRQGEIEHNVEIAMSYLRTIKRICGPKYASAWFICFNLGPYYKEIKHPTRFVYYLKVMRVREQIAGGRFDD